jgi:hypothetical protein
MPRAKVSLPNPANNRSDLTRPSQAPKSAPGQEYGKRTGQEQAQQIIPVGGTPEPAPAPAPEAQSPAPGGLVPLAQGPQPGEIPWLKEPGSGGPPTTGLPNSAGPGPEALTGLGAQWHAQQMSEQGTLQSLLSHLASQPNASSIVKSLAGVAGK